MLVIRKEQIEILEGEMMKSFEDEMVEHLAEFSPALFKVIKDEQMREVVRFGIKRSDEEYGFTFRGPIRLYLELMLLFGSHFDSDPQYPWAIQILKTDAVQMDRAEQLHAKTLDYQEKVSGPDGVNTRKALEQLSDSEPVIYQLLGAVYEKQQKYKDAVAAYEKYLQLAPNGSLAPALRSIIDQLRRDAEGQEIVP